MGKFNEGKGKEMPAVSTASLPDIIFMLLFFFMVTTVLRENTLKVDVVTPDATELTKLVHKSLVNTIFVGRPKEQYQSVYGTAPMLQLGDAVKQPKDIPLFLKNFKAKKEKQQKLIITSLRVDGDVTMGIVQDIKTKLRQSNQLKINYSAKRREEK